jgi:amidophosphoribosyltransferase
LLQPFTVKTVFGQVAVAHNGNLVNFKKLRDQLEERGSIFNTSSDTEVILHLLAVSKVSGNIWSVQ